MADTLILLALAVFVTAWTIQTLVVLERKKNLGDIVASALFFVGLVLFTLYGLSVSDPWFMFFNAVAAALALVNLYYIPRKMQGLRKDMWGVERLVEKEMRGFKHTYHHKAKKRK